MRGPLSSGALSRHDFGEFHCKTAGTRVAPTSQWEGIEMLHENLPADLADDPSGSWDAAIEKRRTPRFESNAAVRVMVGRNFGRAVWSRSVPAVACDVSAGGLLLASRARPARPLARNALVTLQIALDEGPVELHGRVAWIAAKEDDAWICGIEIDDRALPDTARSAFRDWNTRAAGF